MYLICSGHQCSFETLKLGIIIIIINVSATGSSSDWPSLNTEPSSVIKDVWQQQKQRFLFSSVLVSQKAFATVVTAAEKMDASSVTSEERNEIIQYPFKICSKMSKCIYI